MFLAYKGLKPYLFLSYAHKDAERIFPLMERLQQKGCNIWYDEGIHPADEWGETIAKKIADAKAVLVVISKNSMSSFHVKREIYYAVSKNIPMIPFYIEDVSLTDGMDLQLGIFQAIRTGNDVYKDCEALKDAFPKEVVTGEEPTLLYKGKKYSYYFLQHSVCGFSIYRYDHETGEETMFFQNEQPPHSEVESSIECYSKRYSYGDDFYFFEDFGAEGADASRGLSAVLFHVFCDHVSDRYAARYYLDYHFALVDPSGAARLKLLKLLVKDYSQSAREKEVREYDEGSVPSGWKNRL